MVTASMNLQGSRLPSSGAAMINLSHAWLGVALCVAWVLWWGGRAILLDCRITIVDSFYGHSLDMYRFVVAGDWGGLGRQMFKAGYHPPLPPMVGALLAAPFGVSFKTVQLSSLALHCLLVVQVALLARRGTGDNLVVLLAALLTAVSPLLMAWFRTDYPEPLTTVLVVAALHQALKTDLRRPGPALVLGLLLGLGALAKLSFILVMFFPATFFLISRVRHRRALGNAALVLVTAFVVCGWWYVHQFEVILLNFSQSTGSGAGWQSRLFFYFDRAHGNLLLTLAALAGILVAWRQEVMERALFRLLLVAYVPAYLMFVFVFDGWERYILPLLPITCIFAALACACLLRALPATWKNAPLALTAAVLALWSVDLNLAGSECFWGMASQRGISSPETLDYGAVLRATSYLSRQRADVAFFTDTVESGLWAEGQQEIWRTDHPGSPNWLTHFHAQEKIRQGEQVFFMHLESREGRRSGKEFNRSEYRVIRELLGQQQHKVLVRRFHDASPYRVTIYKIPARPPHPGG